MDSYTLVNILLCQPERNEWGIFEKQILSYPLNYVENKQYLDSLAEIILYKVNPQWRLDAPSHRILSTKNYDHFCLCYYSGIGNNHLFTQNCLICLEYRSIQENSNPNQILEFINKNKIPELIFLEISKAEQLSDFEEGKTNELYEILESMDIEKINHIRSSHSKSAIIKDLLDYKLPYFPNKDINWDMLHNWTDYLKYVEEKRRSFKFITDDVYLSISFDENGYSELRVEGNSSSNESYVIVDIIRDTTEFIDFYISDLRNIHPADVSLAEHYLTLESITQNIVESGFYPLIYPPNEEYDKDIDPTNRLLNTVYFQDTLSILDEQSIRKFLECVKEICAIDNRTHWTSFNKNIGETLMRLVMDKDYFHSPFVKYIHSSGKAENWRWDQHEQVWLHPSVADVLDFILKIIPSYEILLDMLDNLPDFYSDINLIHNAVLNLITRKKSKSVSKDKEWEKFLSDYSYMENGELKWLSRSDKSNSTKSPNL